MTTETTDTRRFEHEGNTYQVVGWADHGDAVVAIRPDTDDLETYQFDRDEVDA